MRDGDLATKQKILSATVAILKEQEDPDHITVRQIADRADVAVGAINYHFQSKDNLVSTAVNQMINDAAAPWNVPASQADADPASQLRRLTRDGVTAAFRHHKLSMYSLSHWIMNGEFEVETQILPLLRGIFGRSKDETELRLLAFQLVITIQVAVLRRDTFRRFVGVDLDSEPEREAMIDTLIDNLIQLSRVHQSEPEAR